MVYDEPKAPALRRLSFPRIGMRTIKTVLAAMLAALFMKHVMHQTMFFACIGAITAVEKTVSSSVRASVIRNIGTITGGLVSIAISSFTENIALISLGLIPMILVDNALNKKVSIVPGAIVYFAVAYLNTMDQAWVYGLNRILGTLIGTGIGLLVNFTICPPKKESISSLSGEAG